MTYMTIRKDSRIKKAIVYGGIADTFTSYKYNKVTAKELTVAIGGNPKAKLEEYKSRSAVYWANEIKCPVMVLEINVEFTGVEKIIFYIFFYSRKVKNR